VGPGLGAGLGGDNGTAEGALRGKVREHEHELGVAARELARERLLGAVEDAGDDVAIVRQVDGVQVLGDREYLIDIFPIRLTNSKRAGHAAGTLP